MDASKDTIKAKKAVKVSESYDQDIISFFNKFRANPTELAAKMEECIKMVEVNKDGKKVLVKGKKKYALFKGEEAITEAANKVKTMQPLPEFKEKPEIAIPVPEDPTLDAIKKAIEDKKASGVTINYHYKDLVSDPEIAVLLQLIDDKEKNAGKRRDALLNPAYKYIAVTHKANPFASIVTFAK
jgi:hypothetical protein